MKKLLTILTVAFCSVAALSQYSGKTVQGDIRGKLCNGGSGFCGTVADSINRNSAMKLFQATKTSTTTMIFQIDTSVLSKEDQIRIFGKEYSAIGSSEILTFIQEEDYEFGLDVLAYLELDSRYRILKKGEYPIEILNDTVKVLLTLTRY